MTAKRNRFLEEKLRDEGAAREPESYDEGCRDTPSSGSGLDVSHILSPKELDVPHRRERIH